MLDTHKPLVEVVGQILERVIIGGVTEWVLQLPAGFAGHRVQKLVPALVSPLGLDEGLSTCRPR